MRRRLLFVLLWTAVVVIAARLEGGSDGVRRPLVPPDDVPVLGRPIPGASSRDPILRVTDDGACEEACIGTAFAVDDRGHWVTARHVIDGCQQVAIMTGPSCGVRAVEVIAHPHADVVLLASDPTAPALPRGSRALYQGQDGYHVGYPHGDPGDVHGSLIGRVNVRGRRGGEPGMLWAEVEREPNDELPLGGLSGGPVLDSHGGVIGVAIAASPRRGRMTSAAPESVDQLVEEAGISLGEGEPGNPETEVGRANYGAVGNRLRQRWSVAKLICWHEPETPARRPRVQ